MCADTQAGGAVVVGSSCKEVVLVCALFMQSTCFELCLHEPQLLWTWLEVVHLDRVVCGRSEEILHHCVGREKEIMF